MELPLRPRQLGMAVDRQQLPVPARGLPDQPRDRRDRDRVLAGLRAPAGADADLAAAPDQHRRPGIWVDVWRNMPLILMILYLGARRSEPRGARPTADNIPGWSSRGAPGRARARARCSGSSSTTPRSSARSCARGSSRSTGASARRRRRSGLTYRQQMRFVILPQGLRRMVPATVSQLITLNKDTTLVTASSPSRRSCATATASPGGGTSSARRHGPVPPGLHRDRPAVLRRQLRALATVPPARDPRAQAHRDGAEAGRGPRGPGRARDRRGR